MTPWGTWLTAEENFHGYFWGKVADDSPGSSLKRYGVAGNWYNWGAYYDRFDVTKEPNEANRFGWMVEIDPIDPSSAPMKQPHSAASSTGRRRHRQQGRQGRRLHGRRRALRLCLPLRHRGTYDPTAGGQQGPAR